MIIDQLNRAIHFKSIPKRIVSLVPSQTELLCDLGLEEHLVGVTKFCVHPRYIRSKAAVVGGTKQIHIDRVKALKPDVILCNKEENTKAIVEACERICNVHVSDIYTLEDSLQLMLEYGKLFDRESEAKAMAHKISIEANEFEAFVKDEPSLNTVYFIWKTPWMVAADNTFINHLLERNNFINAYGDNVRYPEIELQINEGVDLVLLSSEPFPFKEKHKNELRQFFPRAKILLVNGELFSWYGSRLLKAFSYFKRLRSNLGKTQLC